MVYHIFGATALLCVAFGENVDDLRNQLQNIKSQLSGAKGGAGAAEPAALPYQGGGGHDYPKDMYQASADGSGQDYQKYMQQYGKSGNYTKYMQNYQEYINRYAGGQGGDQAGGDYSQYLTEYADGNGGGQGDYQQYYDKYMNKYAQNSGYQQYANYQKYIQRYENHLDGESNSVRSARECKTAGCLNKWREASRQNVGWYVPTQYQSYSNNDIDRQYKDRLKELDNGANPLSDTLNLAAVPDQQAGAKELRDSAEAGINKATEMGEKLKKAMSDHEAIEDTASVPSRNCAAVFSKRSEQVGKDIVNLQEQVKSGKTGAHLEKKLQNSMEDAKQLRDHELAALDRAHHDAEASVGHAARGAQTEIRKESRQVQTTLHHLAKKDRSYQATAEKLQKQMEAAADTAENRSEELARIMKERLEDNLASARDEVRNQAERRFDDLQESLSFLVESGEETVSPALLGFLGLASFALTSVVLYAKHTARSVKIQGPTLG